jgi:hypothetical protein
VRLFGGRCACCGERATATAPAGLEPGSPFGNSIAAMVVYLHYAHAIGMERLALLMDELFSLSISEGAISNILARAREPLLAATAAIEKVVRASPIVCSDETSVRVKGKNWWEWVFVTTLAVLHVIKPSRGKAVVTALFGAIQPEVWAELPKVPAAQPMERQRRAPTCSAASVATVGDGRCVWRIYCATRNTPSSAATQRSARRSDGCCCAPSRSADGERR